LVAGAVQSPFSTARRELADTVHQPERLMGYMNSIGFMLLLGAFVKIGYDAHFHIDPMMAGAGVDFRDRLHIANGERWAPRRIVIPPAV
jgi:hypothetical protein